MKPSKILRAPALAAIAAALFCLAATAAPGAAAPAADDIALAAADTLEFAGLEVRGMAWLADGRMVALLVEPDTLPASPPVSSRLAWFSGGSDPDSTRDFTGTLQRGLAFDGKYLWSCGDSGDGGSLLYKIESDTLTVEAAYPTRGHRPCGVAWDGKYVWLVDRDTARLDRFDTELEEITRSILTPGFSPYGLAFDGSFFWVSDSGTGRLYRLARHTGTWNGVAAADSWSRRGFDITLGWDGSSLWFAPPQGSLAVRAVFE